LNSSNPLSYFNWKYGVPEYREGKHLDCGIMTRHLGEWINSNCENTAQFICETKVSTVFATTLYANIRLIATLVMMLPFMILAACLSYSCFRESADHKYAKQEDLSSHSWTALDVSTTQTTKVPLIEICGLNQNVTGSDDEEEEDQDERSDKNIIQKDREFIL
jgi:hypothetical protein